MVGKGVERLKAIVDSTANLLNTIDEVDRENKRFYPVVPSEPSKPSSTPQKLSNLEETVDESEQLPQSEGVNLNRLETDPEKRLAIQKYYPNDHDADRFDMHISGPKNIHNQSRKKCEDVMKQKQYIQSALAKQSDQQKVEYRTHLEAAIDVIRYLLNQGLSFWGHREGESSFNRGNYIELLTWYAKRCKYIDGAFKKAPKHNQLTSPYIQKDIITTCKMETIKSIIKDINDDHFSILVDESRNVSCKEQMTIVLRYVDRRGSVMERFMGIVHIRDTTALSLRNEIVSLLTKYSLSPSSIRGQCYDGASNMQAIINELSVAFQKKEQDIVNAVLLVGVAKDQLQELQKKGWDSLINELLLLQLRELFSNEVD
ncbi:uncharacterized protein LOC142164305 [Nicotiana tabacum]|uniref:Uncharacterized protein LOC142164305 n=1 Tax=Nicotiana tabacum TaxID=4097 RepID=A0AC58RZZ0_TOBAC